MSKSEMRALRVAQRESILAERQKKEEEEQARRKADLLRFERKEKEEKTKAGAEQRLREKCGLAEGEMLYVNLDNDRAYPYCFDRQFAKEYPTLVGKAVVDGKHCGFCGGLLEEIEERSLCYHCYNDYYEDVENGKYPPGLSEEGKENYCFYAWLDIKLAEKGVRDGILIVPQAQARMESIVDYLNGVDTTNGEFKLF
ncbi:MAG: hypothetical protein Q4B29_01270 [Candidatus Saccharibacteria bacterium]|nr:hypothetical protein [Candidatus Saccharibacteria bacterium]